MSNASALAAIEYEAETVFAEDITTFATHRVPVNGKVDISGLKHDKIAPDRVVQRLQDGTSWILGVMGGSVKTKLWLHGHGATTAGATTIDPVETFLKQVFGNADVSAAAGTTLTGGTATVPLTTASGTFGNGTLCRIGTLNDAKGNGQFYPISSHVTTSLNLLVALDGTPANADVLYSAVNFYLPEDATNAVVVGTRMRVLSANLRYELHGCYPMNVTIDGLGVGEIPYIEIEWGVSWFRYSTAAFPSAVTSNQYNPAPCAAGSLFLNDVGTTTRVKRTYRDFNIKIKLGVVELPGPGGANVSQRIIGAKRTPSDIEVSWVEDADAATLTPALDGFFTGTTKKHLCWTGSTTPGSAIGIYFPQLCISGARPFQYDDKGINRVKITAKAYTGPTTTTDREASAMRMAYA